MGRNGQFSIYNVWLVSLILDWLFFTDFLDLVKQGIPLVKPRPNSASINQPTMKDLVKQDIPLVKPRPSSASLNQPTMKDLVKPDIPLVKPRPRFPQSINQPSRTL
ncbi:hypothetical protein RRG08_011747 [Elysia crispata]|uniref:Uncharacterized protein n=1 Tax=Elysia crispata TaxID=231223 RepID=A0AAE0XEL6_9GAST|nr:hypothetical protein RRG08_011747 [Elysia crispata]